MTLENEAGAAVAASIVGVAEQGAEDAKNDRGLRNLWLRVADAASELEEEYNKRLEDA